MKRKLFAIFSIILCASLFVALGLSAYSETIIDKKNYATDSAVWAFDPFPDATVIGENGIIFDDYGSGQNYAGISYKSLIPYENTIEIKFVAEIGAGTFKIVFGDISGKFDGKALKSWEKPNEHIALEIGAGSITLWHYNPVSGSSTTIGMANPTEKYLDGNEHTVVITSKPTDTTFGIKITVDSNTHIDDSITTTTFADIQSVLTIGVTGTTLNENSVTVSSLTITDNNPDNADKLIAKVVSDAIAALPELNRENFAKVKLSIEKIKTDYNVLTSNQKIFVLNYEIVATYESAIADIEEAIKQEGIANEKEKWNYADADEKSVSFGANKVIISNFGNDINADISLKEKAAPSNTISFDYEYKEGKENSINGLKLTILDVSSIDNGSNIRPWVNSNKAFIISFDTDGNLWGVFYNEAGDIVKSAGEWVPALLKGIHSIQITVTPSWSGEDSCIYIKVYIDNVLKLNTYIDDMSLVGNSVISLGGATNGGLTDDQYIISNFKIANNITSEPADLSTNASLWNVGGGKISSEGLYAGKGAAMYDLKQELPLEGTWSFDFRADDNYTATNKYATWSFFNIVPDKFVDISNWQNNLLDATTNIALRLTISDNAFEFHKVTYGGTEGAANILTNIVNKTAAPNIVDGKIYRITYTTVMTESGLAITVSIDDTEIFETVLGDAFTTAKCLRFSGRITNSANAFYINNFKVNPTSAQVNAANFMNAIYEVNQVVSIETLSSLKEAISQLKTEYSELENATKQLVSNYGYVLYVQQNIVNFEKEVSDRAAAKLVEDLIKEFPVSIAESNIDSAKSALAAAKQAYNALTADQKVFVTNYTQMEVLEQNIMEYETQLAKQTEDTKAANGVKTKINALTTEITAENIEEAKAKLTEAKTAYNALTEDQKKLVDNYAKINQTEAAIETFEANNKPKKGCSGSAVTPVMLIFIGVAVVFAIQKRKVK